jgi:hypothetical protein
MELQMNYNYSSLVAAYQCQEYYKYRYIDQIKQDEILSGDLLFGSAIHYALEQYLIDKSNIVHEFQVYWSNATKKKVSYGRFSAIDLSTQAEILLERFVRLHAKKIVPKELEQTFHGTVGEFSVYGTPDCIGEFEGVMSIIDFKTSGYRYNKDRIKVSEQMVMYAHLAEQCKQYQIKQLVYIVFIKGKEPSIQILKQELTDSVKELLLTNIKAQIYALEKIRLDNERYTRNTGNCIRGEIVCPFFKKCWEGK